MLADDIAGAVQRLLFVRRQRQLNDSLRAVLSNHARTAAVYALLSVFAAQLNGDRKHSLAIEEDGFRQKGGGLPDAEFG